MRRLLCLLLLICALPAFGASFLENRPSPTLGGPAVDNSKDFLPVRQAFQLNLSDTTPDAIKLQFIATEGYYLYRHRFQFRTEPADIGLGAAQLPDGEKKHDEYFGDVEVYHGILDVSLPRKRGDSRHFTLVVTYQGCADKGLCYPPETERLSIGGASPAESDTPLAGDVTQVELSWKQLVLFFLAGVGLTFTPCVLPMLPILSGVVLRGQIGGLRGFSLSLAYVLPMAVCFALLGALMGMFGASLNLQARLQSAWVLVPFAGFFALFAIAMFGVFELRLPRAINERLDRIAGNTQGGSLWGAAVLGIVSSLLVSPCVHQRKRRCGGWRDEAVRAWPGHGCPAGHGRNGRRGVASEKRAMAGGGKKCHRRAASGPGHWIAQPSHSRPGHLAPNRFAGSWRGVVSRRP
jgi:thiol:disulfide interchange protein DsbD